MLTIDEQGYNTQLARIEELLTNPENIENPESRGFEKLNRLSDMVADFEEKNYRVLPITPKKYK